MKKQERNRSAYKIGRFLIGMNHKGIFFKSMEIIQSGDKALVNIYANDEDIFSYEILFKNGSEEIILIERI